MSGEPNADHFFGTDQQGRDIFSRVIFGTRTTLTVAIVAVLFGTTGGAVLGVVSAYAGGKVDLILQLLPGNPSGIPPMSYSPCCFSPRSTQASGQSSSPSP